MLTMSARRCPRPALVTILTMLAAVSATPNRGADAVAAPDSNPAPSVILLTGFEPFGTGRPPNSSWQGIRRLDGLAWRGYRLVCREMKVEWGQPLRQLEAWSDELHPAAIFSFGQGGADGYRIETVAHNRRGNGRDNAGAPPPEADIVAGGPDSVGASCRADAFVTALAARRHPVAASNQAGRYLCEECLYSLERLRSVRKRPTDVLFCHVPPLGATAGGQRITAEQVELFVLDLLDAWLSDRRGVAPVQPPQGHEAEVRALISRYFERWSAQDIDGYGECFDPGATVQLLDGVGRVQTASLDRFLESQRQAHRLAAEPMVETAESVEISWADRLAHVVVRWKLRKGKAAEEVGYDHFTLRRVDGRWRIVNLVFYAID